MRLRARRSGTRKSARLSSPPETFLLDGKQHVLATGATGLYMFVLN